MFYRLNSSLRHKYSLTLRLLVLLLLVHTIASACSTDSTADEETDMPRERRTAASPDTLAASRSLERATTSLLGNPFVANRQQSNNLSTYFDRIDADFTVDADAIENLHNPDVTDTIYTIRFGNSMMEFYAPTHSGDLHLQAADIRSASVSLRNNLRVGMSQAELMKSLKGQGSDIRIMQTPNEIVASNREGAPITLHFYLQKGKVSRIKYDGYVD
ncbi:hypothetical protein [Pontibacter actiniarum]|uniref:DUF4251 domain-containing protein n=1 Tax=Pontibacter actiniarum TaxID=323450 RepID=A0A1X9YM95_9BACT|nr:hypothetical protein [Pontibacter actiniarum]ARS33987.1 hypothetical protein CA264_00230 [Pontibacter actiniarum]